jgi:regulator of protease activity HflC (stomatin/prohibitin superfamily)
MPLLLRGFIIINPNEAIVLVLFGTYTGSVKSSGFYWVNPFTQRNRISLRARNLNGQSLKVNDKIGNPVEIAAVIVWQVEDTAKAVFEVDDYNKYVNIQSEASVRHLAGICPYDNFEEETAEVTLRGGTEKVNELLERELNERLSPAGIKVIEARISHLAYAQEIAGAMLRRQQATAVVAARRQIVEGAVGMVEMALAKLSEREIVQLDEERKAAMVSNLLVVLCGDKEVNPIVNTGTLHH